MVSHSALDTSALVPIAATTTSQKAETAEQEQHKYDPTLTARVIAATGPGAHPRLAAVMPALVRHLHDFAREVGLTVAEWMAAVDMINECGRMSDDKRNETQMLCDILGLETLVDEITTATLLTTTPSSGQQQQQQRTPSAILGPFYRADAPRQANGTSIVRGLTPATPWHARAVADSAFITGRVRSAARDGPTLSGAVVDVWLAAPNGLYEQQDPAQPDMNLRGRFTTDADGAFAFYALRPTAYPIPTDGPAGRLLVLLDRHAYRPGHLHFLVTAPRHRALVTQLFDARDLPARAAATAAADDDAVFAVKHALVVGFVPREGDDRARWTLEYDFVLVPETESGSGSGGAEGAVEGDSV